MYFSGSLFQIPERESLNFKSGEGQFKQKGRDVASESIIT